MRKFKKGITCFSHQPFLSFHSVYYLYWLLLLSLFVMYNCDIFTMMTIQIISRLFSQMTQTIMNQLYFLFFSNNQYLGRDFLCYITFIYDCLWKYFILCLDLGIFQGFFVITWSGSALSIPTVCMQGCVKKPSKPCSKIQGTKSLTFYGSRTDYDMLSGGTND